MLKEARELFDGMSEKDEISWSAMVDGYIKGGCHKEALEIFNEMQKENLLSPRKFILSSVLAACANVEQLIKESGFMLISRGTPSRCVLGLLCLIVRQMWAARHGNKEEISTWNAMIGGLAMTVSAMQSSSSPRCRGVS
ncbi:pentatricopeptide repeat-containing protein [Prunus yedoensis var. nudiflora]|uniref:Pentatricopeptide repeat-containing protein n=1 Tax=Prunus yedoensis var. nudiflora TaxID=2094558 RepID=A0A314UK31_PRUYE|nr:pentatricopeptide repeat-containing protein [Prunus yedoensis var. nudiflora]